MGDLLAGVHYPRNWEECVAWFAAEADCRDYLDWLRWGQGFVCPHCGAVKGWRRGDGRWPCAGCGRTVSQTAATIFDKSRTPLTLWFAAAWHMAVQKNGISSLGLRQDLELGSTQTAWHMLHRFRSAMVRDERTQLGGSLAVEVDETYVGGEEEGPGGRGALGKCLVVVAIEIKRPRGYGRCRLAVVPNASASALQGFVRTNVQPGSSVITDGWPSYRGLKRDYQHRPVNVSESEREAHEELPGVHRIASLLKRWLVGTHQGSVLPGHLQAYLDEFTFRFNRRGSRHRGLLFYRLLEGSVAGEPLRYAQLIQRHSPRREGRHPTPPVAPQRVHVRPAATLRPWRTTTS